MSDVPEEKVSKADAIAAEFDKIISLYEREGMPDSGCYVMPFAIEPSLSVPSGSYNMARDDFVRMLLPYLDCDES